MSGVHGYRKGEPALLRTERRDTRWLLLFWESFGPFRESQAAGLRHAAEAWASDADPVKHRVLSVLLSLFPDPNCSAKLHWKTPLVKDLSSRE